MTDPSLTLQNDAERAALDDLDARFRGSLQRYFSRKISDLSTVDDLVQEVFVRLLKRGDVASLDELSGYVFRTASATLADWLRRRQVRHATVHDTFDIDKHGGVDFSAHHVLEHREELTKATALLLELPERTRTIFLLRRLKGMKNRDIAARLDISVSAIEKHIARAVEHLLNRMDR